MKVTVNSVKRLCSDADLPVELVERHLDALTMLVIRVAQWQNKKDASKVRAWWFENKPVKMARGWWMEMDPTKKPLFELLSTEEDKDIME